MPPPASSLPRFASSASPRKCASHDQWLEEKLTQLPGAGRRPVAAGYRASWPLHSLMSVAQLSRRPRNPSWRDPQVLKNE